MKLSPIFALIAETWAQEATTTTDLSLDELFESAINDVARSTGNDYYNDYEYDYDYYYDALGNKKKKKKKQNKQKQQNNNSYQAPVSNYKPQNNKPASNNWAPQNSWGAKGTTWNADRSPLIGNGRFCWNCYARADENGSAYQNCFDGEQKGFLEMCTGEEYFCMWNERRQSGRVTEVGGGCKSDHSCLDQMTENFKWKTVTNGNKKEITGDQCRAGLNKNAGIAYENSVCTWCCDAMVTNRFAPTESDLCNFKTHADSPAKKYFDTGSTEAFEWFNATNQFAGLYTDGQYHRMFMIAIQVALGQGILSG